MDEDSEWDAAQEAALEVIREVEAKPPSSIFKSKPLQPSTDDRLFHQNMALISDPLLAEGPVRKAGDFTSAGSSLLQSPLQSKRSAFDSTRGVAGNAMGQSSLPFDSPDILLAVKKRKVDIENELMHEARANHSVHPSSARSTAHNGLSFDDDEGDNDLEMEANSIIQNAQGHDMFGISEEQEAFPDSIDFAAHGESLESQKILSPPRPLKQNGSFGISFGDESEEEFENLDEPVRFKKPRSQRELDANFEGLMTFPQGISLPANDQSVEKDKEFAATVNPISSTSASALVNQHPSTSFTRPNLSTTWGSRTLSTAASASVARSAGNLFDSATHNFSEIPINSFGFAKAVSSHGTYLYFPKKKSIPLAPLGSSSGPLLSDRISKLMDDVREKIKYNEALRRNDSELALERDDGFDDDRENENLIGSKKVEKKLWVDKYAPKLYVDLVGDEQINRAVLSWVKSWDFCVFGKECKSTLAREDDASRGRFKYKNPHPPQPIIDRKKRPEKRILLLSGPPGLGKTTLAHVIAKHAGYNVLEVNASVDRTGSSVSKMINSSLESQASFISKPSLVIIDEIDGVSSVGGENSFITQLVALARGDSRKKKSTTLKKKGKKSDQKPKELNKPIICICNDAHAPALRELLQVSLHIVLKAPALQSLASRLNEICKWEGMESSLQSMMSLCEVSQGDMRSAINTLQFLKRKTNKISQKDIDGLAVGSKDISYGWSKVCHAIFQRPRSTGSRLEKEKFKKADSSDDYIARISQLINGYGDSEFIMQACFENYLNSKLFDVTAKDSNVESRFVQQGNHIIFFDSLQKRVATEHAFELQAYSVYPIANFYRLFASTRPMTIEFPMTVFQVDSATKQIKSLLANFWAGFNPYLQSIWFNKSNIIMELAPLLMYIISPSFKPVNVQILKPIERQILDRLVSILVGFGLTLGKESTDTNTIEFSLDPPINLLVDLYPFCNSRRTISDMSYSSSQLIAHECELFKARMALGKWSKTENVSASGQPIGNTKKDDKSNSSTSPKLPKSALNPMERTVQLEDLIPTALVMAVPDKVVVKDFFGRVVVPKENRKTMTDAKLNDGNIEKGVLGGNSRNQFDGNSSSTANRKSFIKFKAPNVSFKFNEGYSNAVRKPLFLSDLL